MKAILEFNLPEDNLELNRCTKSLDMACVLFEIQRNIKRKVENNIDSLNRYETLELVFDLINEQYESNNINIDELI